MAPARNLGALLPLLLLPMVAAWSGCDDAIPACEDGGCGGGPSGSTSSTTITTTSTSTSTSDASSSSTGGPAWALPACADVKGPVPLTFSSDRGATLAPFEAKVGGIAYFNGLAASDVANTLFADYAGGFYVSSDAGCTFTLVAETELGPASVVAAKGGGAFGYLPNDVALYRYDAANGYVRLKDLPEGIAGLGVDAADGQHVRVVSTSGRTWDSVDGGNSFVEKGVAVYPGGNGFLYSAAFDPKKLDHAFAGSMVDGGFTTFDGGATWQPATGLGKPEGDNKANVFAAVVSSVDSNIVWAQGIALGKPSTMPPVPDDKNIFFSKDGGLTFEVVLTQSPEVTLTNGVPMLADPADADALYFEFGTYYDGYGTDLFRIDASTKMLTKTHNGYNDMNVFVASPADPTFLYLAVTSSTPSGVGPED